MSKKTELPKHMKVLLEDWGTRDDRLLKIVEVLYLAADKATDRHVDMGDYYSVPLEDFEALLEALEKANQIAGGSSD